MIWNDSILSKIPRQKMRNKIFIIIILSGIIFPRMSFSQLSISNGVHTMDIWGSFNTYYNHVILKPGKTDYSNNMFMMKDAQLQIDGRVGKKYEYQVQIDFADLPLLTHAYDATGLLQATSTYKGLSFMDITAGYGKTPYSRNSMMHFDYSPFWKRTDLTNGALFSRRDLGITLSKSALKQRLTISAGAYSGLGEMSLQGLGESSGSPEYCGRVQMDWPSRYRFREVDTRIVPIPMFSIAANARYANKKLAPGTTLPLLAGGDFGNNVIAGEKTLYGMDAAFQFKGFSVIFEIDQMKAVPTDTTSTLFEGVTPANSKGYFMAGGYYIQVNYFYKPLHSILAARYDEVNLNDLAPGIGKHFSVAYCYQLKGYSSMIRIQYLKNLAEESINTHSYAEEFRIGYQLMFK